MTAWIIVSSLAALIVGFGVGTLLQLKRAHSRLNLSRNEARRITDEAEKQAELTRRTAELEAKEIAERGRRELEQEIKERQGVLLNQEKRLDNREETLDRRADLLDRQEAEHRRRERDIAKREQQAADLQRKYEQLLVEAQQQLERVAGMSAEEARKRLMEQMLEEARHEAAKQIRTIEEEARQEADRKAKKVLATAVQRYAGDYVSEATVSVVHLPNEEMKGRIIGREGRNIRALEAATGMDLIIDDTPECVIVSGFDPVRREIARMSLEKLIADGRIHPARIEEVVSKTQEEMERIIREAGEQATFELGIHGLHRELVKYLGRLKFRTSYTQNQLQHSLETGFLCGIMAAELGLNPRQARRAGLLHDIGKAIDHEVEGSHAAIGADLLKKHGESPKIVHAVRAHHEEIKPETVLAVLVQAADALSGARPGARREMLETYVKRIEELEKISRSFKGVEKAYAIQAGREVRVIVENTKVSDDQALLLSKDIAAKIEKELTYPGQIKITVIRETRAVDYAR
ncbi:MAG: ribonuclease Y [Deltaproteobacteria bacterium]|nr:MAG: ribonuclease Y [Deltaproteobacteria bacterium]